MLGLRSNVRTWATSRSVTQPAPHKSEVTFYNSRDNSAGSIAGESLGVASRSPSREEVQVKFSAGFIIGPNDVCLTTQAETRRALQPRLSPHA